MDDLNIKSVELMKSNLFFMGKLITVAKLRVEFLALYGFCGPFKASLWENVAFKFFFF